MNDAALVGKEIIQKHSKSFAFASKLLPPEAQSHAVAVYAWCRRADDAIDLVEPAVQPAALETLRKELREVYAGATVTDPVLAIFQTSVKERGIPERYALDLLTGMEMDVEGGVYHTLDQLYTYCYHVAGCVGLMMCHVMGLKDDRALRNAAHLGMGMQLTNICRDVEEDWRRGRLYLPDELLARFGAKGLQDKLGGTLPDEDRRPVAEATDHLLVEADRFYESGDAGLPALPARCALAIRTARSVYSSIGGRIRAQGCDPLAGRAYVPSSQKLVLALGALAATAAALPARLVDGSRTEATPPEHVLTFPDDILPIA